ncbi:MAG: hypothetical protein ACK4ND_04005 [Cytophagaceae bacterium]
MRILLVILFTLALSFSSNTSYAQSDEKPAKVKKDKKKGMGTQEDLDRDNKKAYKKSKYEKMKDPEKKKKQKKNDVTRKKAEKIANKRLKKAKNRVKVKKKKARR